jgi:hypothetical protein
MVTGAVVSIVYGELCVTYDLDLIIEMQMKDVEKFVTAFPADAFYCPPAEIIETEMRRKQRGHFNLIHHETGFKADIYLSGQDELHKWAFQRKIDINLDKHTIWLAPVEYVITRKLEYFREGRSQKHLRDIKSIVGISSDRIDSSALEALIKERGLAEEWKLAQLYDEKP